MYLLAWPAFSTDICMRCKLPGKSKNIFSGTSVPNLSDKGLLQSHQVTLPAESLLNAFYEFVLMVQTRLLKL